MLKGFYDTHAQLAYVPVSYKHAKRRVNYVYIRKHWMAYFSYTETVTHMRGLHDGKIRYASMNVIFKRS